MVPPVQVKVPDCSTADLQYEVARLVCEDIGIVVVRMLLKETLVAKNSENVQLEPKPVLTSSSVRCYNSALSTDCAMLRYRIAHQEGYDGIIMCQLYIDGAMLDRRRSCSPIMLRLLSLTDAVVNSELAFQTIGFKLTPDDMTDIVQTVRPADAGEAADLYYSSLLEAIDKRIQQINQHGLLVPTFANGGLVEVGQWPRAKLIIASIAMDSPEVSKMTATSQSWSSSCYFHADYKKARGIYKAHTWPGVGGIPCVLRRRNDYERCFSEVPRTSAACQRHSTGFIFGECTNEVVF